jgi:S1-C subfamily serine protease
MNKRRLLRKRPDSNAIWGDLSALEAEDTNRWFRRSLSRWVFLLTSIFMTSLAAVLGYFLFVTLEAQPNTPEVTNRVQESTVLVYCKGSQGTGVAIDVPKPDGIKTIIISAAHIFDECDENTVVVVEYEGRELNGLLVAKEPDVSNPSASPGESTDLARIDLRYFIPPLEPAPKANMGDWAIIVGNPLDRTNYATLGIVSAVKDRYYETDAAANEGSSGGPMVDRLGRVLGIVSSYQLKEGVDETVVAADGMVRVMRLSQACGTLFPSGACPFKD